MIKVLHVIETPGTGGAERVLVDVARSLSAGFHSTGLTLVEGWTANELRAHGIETHVLPLKRSFDLSWPVRFAAFLRRHAIDVVHCHEFTGSCYAALGCALAGRPLVITMHGKNYWPERAYRRNALRWAGGRSEAFVMVSDDLKRFAMQVLCLRQEAIRVVPNGIDLERFGPVMGNREATRAALGASSEDVVVISVGALEPVKAHDILLQAMAEVSRDVPGVRLWLVGEGYLRADLEAQSESLGLRDRVKFLGWRTDIPQLLGAADFSVLASHSEGMPLAVMESMACARTVVATRVGGLPELVEDGVTGSLVAAGSVSELAQAIQKLAIEGARRIAFGVSAHARARDRFSLQAMAATYEAVYRAAVTKRCKK